jgi:hypothetical protein
MNSVRFSGSSAFTISGDRQGNFAQTEKEIEVALEKNQSTIKALPSTVRLDYYFYDDSRGVPGVNRENLTISFVSASGKFMHSSKNRWFSSPEQFIAKAIKRADRLARKYQAK